MFLGITTLENVTIAFFSKRGEQLPREPESYHRKAGVSGKEVITKTIIIIIIILLDYSHYLISHSTKH
jgi:hypothetical protein